jgi:accessory gene regulator protein AgrB
MLYLFIKAGTSGVIVAMVSEIARRSPGRGALLASLPLISILGMIWLWRDTGDVDRMAAHAEATFWYVLPSLPMFILVPVLLRRDVSFWLALGAGCALTIFLYALMTGLAQRLGIRL